MSTPLTDSINALTQYANETTGKQDTTLSDAVQSLVEGYGQGGFEPLKTVTLDEDHIRDAVGQPNYWKTFLGLDNEDFDQNYICAFFVNNTASSYACNLIMWFNNNGSFVAMSVRQNWSNVAFTLGCSLYASAGTIISVYKIPK